jgi:hypothetical protein
MLSGMLVSRYPVLGTCYRLPSLTDQTVPEAWSLEPGT